jgi:hypothetical protein
MGMYIVLYKVATVGPDVVGWYSTLHHVQGVSNILRVNHGKMTPATCMQSIPTLVWGYIELFL